MIRIYQPNKQQNIYFAFAYQLNLLKTAQIISEVNTFKSHFQYHCMSLHQTNQRDIFKCVLGNSLRVQLWWWWVGWWWGGVHHRTDTLPDTDFLKMLHQY